MMKGAGWEASQGAAIGRAAQRDTCIPASPHVRHHPNQMLGSFFGFLDITSDIGGCENNLCNLIHKLNFANLKKTAHSCRKDMIKNLEAHCFVFS